MKLNSVEIVFDGAYEPGSYQWMVQGDSMLIRVFYRDFVNGEYGPWRSIDEQGNNPRDARVVAEAVTFVAEMFD